MLTTGTGCRKKIAGGGAYYEPPCDRRRIANSLFSLDGLDTGCGGYQIYDSSSAGNCGGVIGVWRMATRYENLYFTRHWKGETLNRQHYVLLCASGRCGGGNSIDISSQLEWVRSCVSERFNQDCISECQSKST